VKITVFILLISAVLIFSCEKSNNDVKYKNTGTITGMDNRLCYFPMCGGYLIQIDSIEYHFDKSELPPHFKFSDNSLPIRVSLDWELKTGIYTGYNWIKILKIRSAK
jgi:hypothetical protein